MKKPKKLTRYCQVCGIEQGRLVTDGVTRCLDCYNYFRMNFSDGTPVFIYEKFEGEYDTGRSI